MTAQATWTTADDKVATVNGGAVAAVGLGTASVSVEYQGLSQVVAVTVRRRTMLVGSIRLSDAAGQQSIVNVRSFVDDKNMGYTGTSHAQVTLEVQWNRTIGFINDPDVTPGTHLVSIDVPDQAHPPNEYVSDRSSYVEVLDADTFESLAVIPLPAARKTLSAIDQATGDHKMTWSVEIETFSS